MPYLAPKRHGLVVVLDDNRDVLEVYESILSHEGYAVAAVASLDAVTALFHRADAPALLILDCFLPGRTGVELLERLWAEFPVRMGTLPVVGVSPLTPCPWLLDRFAFRVTEFVEKPNEVKDLVAMVAKYVCRPTD